MKTISKVGIMLAMAGSLFMTSCAGSYYVTDQPAEPRYERPARPYQNAVWIDGEWAWRGGSYTYVQGYWVRPRAGRAWVRGGWYHSPRGYAWHKGHWN